MSQALGAAKKVTAAAAAACSPDERRAKREEVLAYVTESIDANDRSAITEALESNRGLVEKESDPLKFLQCENGDVEAAAKRLAAYWEERKEVFAERFLLPLVITGEGALDESSVAALSTGLMVFLPDDAKGRSVLYLDYDVDRANGLFGVEKRTERGRLRFYMMHRAAERGRPLVCVRYSQSTNMDKVKMLAFQRFLKVFPVVLDSLMMVFLSPPAASRVFTDTVIPLTRQYLKDLPETASLHPILGSTSQELFAELKKFSFVAKGLPEKLGGTWTWDTFQTWLKARRDIESIGDSKPPAVLAAMPSSSSSSVAAGTAPPFASIAPVTTAEDRIRQAEERRNRKRQKDLEYSRERRNREKDEYDVTQLKVDALRKTQSELKEEEARLVSLLADALDQVDIHLYGKPTMSRTKVATSSAPSTESTTETSSDTNAQRTSTDAASAKNKKASASKDRHKKRAPRRSSSSLRTSSAAEERREASAADSPTLSPARDAGSRAPGIDDSNAAGQKAGTPQDMFPLGSLQGDRLHAGVPALGMPQQNNDHLLALLLQQQRSQQGLHPFAPQLHPLDQLRLQQEQARGAMLGQYGMAAPAYGVPIYLAAPPPRALDQESAAAAARNESADLAALRSMLERRLATGSAGLSNASSAAATNPSSSLGSQLHMLQLLNRQQPGTHPMQQVLPTLSSPLLPPGLSYPGASGGPSVSDAAAQGIDALLLQRYRSNRDG